MKSCISVINHNVMNAVNSEVCMLYLSIQRAAVWVLDQYYTDFPIYNPALLNLPKSVLSKKMSGFKVYSLGEGAPNLSQFTALLVSVSHVQLMSD